MPPTGGGGGLAGTGANIARFIAIAMGMLLVGGAVVSLARRRQSQRATS